MKSHIYAFCATYGAWSFTIDQPLDKVYIMNIFFTYCLFQLHRFLGAEIQTELKIQVNTIHPKSVFMHCFQPSLRIS